MDIGISFITSQKMNALYLYTSKDVITELATPLEVEGYRCGVIELTGNVHSGF